MSKSLVKTPDAIEMPATRRLTASESRDAVKLAKLLIKSDRDKQQLQTIGNIANVLLTSPLVQIVGTVAACEILEKKEYISPGWATGIEAGSIALVGLHVLKNYGVLGLGITTAAGVTGGALGDFSESTNSKITDISSPSAGGFPGAILDVLSTILRKLL